MARSGNNASGSIGGPINAAGEVQPPSQSLTGPGVARALGLRARTHAPLSVPQTASAKEKDHVVRESPQRPAGPHGAPAFGPSFVPAGLSPPARSPRGPQPAEHVHGPGPRQRRRRLAARRGRPPSGALTARSSSRRLPRWGEAASVR